MARPEKTSLSAQAKLAILGLAGLIGGGIASACTDWIADKVKSVGLLDALWSWLTTSHAVTFTTLGWVMVGIVGIFVLWGVRSFRITVAEPWYLSFTKMRWRGVLWEWRYNGNRLHFPSITCYCPECDARIVPLNIGAYASVPHIGLKCDHCQRQYGEPLDGDVDDLHRMVFIEYERRTRRWAKGSYPSMEAMVADDQTA